MTIQNEPVRTPSLENINNPNKDSVGRVVRSISSFYYIWYGKEVYECKARGILKKRGTEPVAGDQVLWKLVDREKQQGIIEKVLQRDNFLLRPPIANVTQAILIFSVKNPAPNLSLIDRFIVLAAEQGLKIALCFSKMDLDEKGFVQELLEDYKHVGYPVLSVSSIEKKNISEIRKIMEGEINVLAGPSGAGKSSLLNEAIPHLELKTGEVSIKTGRGKHTTRHVELLKVGEDTWVADTPGFSSLSLQHIPENELKKYFEEFLPLEEECRFGKNCFHENEPQCGVKDAVNQKKISKRRYESYLQLLTEIKNMKKRR